MSHPSNLQILNMAYIQYIYINITIYNIYYIHYRSLLGSDKDIDQ